MIYRSQRNATYRLAPHGLLGLLSYITQGHQPKGRTVYSDLDLLTSITTQKNTPQANLVKAFSELKFPLPK